MTEREIGQVESALGFKLPEGYRATLLEYPFSPASCAADMLPDDPATVIDLNSGGATPRGISHPLFVGCDSGEEYYFVDASHPASPVYTYELETKHHLVLADSWQGYLEHIRKTDIEIAADVAQEEERVRNRKWWQVWK